MQSHQPGSWELQIQRQTSLRPSLTQGHTIKCKTGSCIEHHGYSRGNGKLVWAGFLERAALALLTGSSPGGRGRKALGQESAGSRTWFGRAGAQLSSVPLRGSQGTGFAGTAHEGCQAQTWSRGRSEAPRRPGQSPESPGHLPRRQRQGCQLRESSDGPGGEALRLPRR